MLHYAIYQREQNIPLINYKNKLHFAIYQRKWNMPLKNYKRIYCIMLSAEESKIYHSKTIKEYTALRYLLKKAKYATQKLEKNILHYAIYWRRQNMPLNNYKEIYCNTLFTEESEICLSKTIKKYTEIIMLSTEESKVYHSKTTQKYTALCYLLKTAKSPTHT